MCNRTSGNSSLSIWRNIGKRWEIVLGVCQHHRLNECDTEGAYSSLPRIGASPLIWVPSAALTCCEVSETKSSMLVMISFKRVSRSSNVQKPIHVSRNEAFSQRGSKPGIWPAIAVRTSASLSLRSFTKAGTRSLDTVSSSTAFAICVIC